MASRLIIRTITLTNGERLPLPIERATGIPLYKPTLFALTEARQRNRATATILRTLRELSVFFDFISEHDIQLEERMKVGQLLSLWEIDALARRCREHIGSADHLDTDQTSLREARVLSLEKVRMRRAQSKSDIVAPQTAANRIRTIHAYLEWLTSTYLSGHSLTAEYNAMLRSASADALGTLLQRIPKSKGRNTLEQREGIPNEVLDRILTMIDPASPENPWRDRFARARNVLIIYLLRTLGLRRGELLNIKISDIDFRKNEISILRRPDDPMDPRIHQPRVKTRERILPLTESLVTVIEHHILYERARIPGAKKQAFLFITERTGQPMSLAALNKLFRVLRAKLPDLPEDFSPHVLRHDWNDEFSERMDARKISEAEEQRYRSYLMGWSPTSNTAATYTRRHVRNKAMAVSLEIQAGKPRKKSE
ncbi:site-specific integrase [Chromobacterium amazonense]|uniref:Site-specific integrase n=1 Tax=Chromobacterium amazonense TaxID=1382803 RepID=A0ABU8V6K7_9NEIS|nr:site-specific integrase [Chromobacterium amazonense]MDQ4539025.1 site-specific integrase [Chromobacterium amazonense]